MPSAATLGFVGDVLGSLTSAFGASESSKLQKDIAKKGVRWRVEDMKAAGLNPMLAAMNGALSSPSQVNPPNVGESFEGIGSKYVASKIASAQLRLLDEQANQASSAAALAESQINVNHEDANRKVMENDILREAVPFSAENARSQSELLKNDVSRGVENVRGLKLSNDQLERIQPLLVTYQELVNKIQALGIPEAQATARFFESAPGAKWVDQISKILGVDAAKVVTIFRNRGKK